MNTLIAVDGSPWGNPKHWHALRMCLMFVYMTGMVLSLFNLPSYVRRVTQDEINNIEQYLSSIESGNFPELGIIYSYVVLTILYSIISFGAACLLLYRAENLLSVLFSVYLIASAMIRGFDSPGHIVFNIVISVAALIVIFPVLCIFPNGNFIPRWSRWLFLPYIGTCIIPVYINFARLNDAPTALLVRLSLFFWTVFVGVGVCFLIYRFRRQANRQEQWRIRQLIAGAIISIALLSISNILYFGSIGNPSGPIRFFIDPVLDFTAKIVLVGTMFLAAESGRQWNLDLVVNRGLVYGILFSALATIFVGLLFIIQSFLQVALGLQQSTLAATLATGITVAAFNPTRRRLQNLIDRQLFGLRIGLNRIAVHDQPQAMTMIAPFQPGTLARLGDYELHEVIGRGGMGEVYRGYHTSLAREVAIKVLPPHLSTSGEFRIRFEREARIMATLHHPNIVDVYDFGRFGDMQYIVMEYMRGEDLSLLLHKHPHLPPHQISTLIQQIADALNYAHAQGIVHRDVKPSNVMLRAPFALGTTPQPVLMDFGLTKFIDTSSGLTQTGPIGTLAYMSPEQISAAREVDYRADIYAFGVMCYQLYTGRLPFTYTNQAALLFAHLHKPAPDPRSFNPDLSPHIAATLLQALHKNPVKRPESAHVFATELLYTS